MSMKKLNLLVLFVFSASLLFSQAYKPKKKKKDFFGKQKIDNRQVGNLGMHIGLGPSFSLASDNKNQITLTDSQGNPLELDISQKGKVGASASLGLNYFNKKAGWFSFGRLVDYYEAGVGFNYYRGIEKTVISDRNTPISSGQGDYSAGFLSTKIGIHKILTIPHTKLFVDNGLAVHGDFNLLQASKNYSNFIGPGKFTPTSIFQANYSLGIGFNLGKGSYLIPTAFIPIFSFKEMGKQSVYWFDSRYYPINVQLKWLYRFNKAKSKTGCTPPDKAPMPAPEGGK